MISHRINAVAEALLLARVELSTVDYLAGEVVDGRAREDRLERLVTKLLAQVRFADDSTYETIARAEKAEAELVKLRGSRYPAGFGLWIAPTPMSTQVPPHEPLTAAEGAALFELLAAGEIKPTEPPVPPADTLATDETAPANACDTCDGRGEILDPNDPGRPCAACDGTGKTCGWCSEAYGEDHVCRAELATDDDAYCHEEAIKMQAARKALGIPPVTVEEARERFIDAITPREPVPPPSPEDVKKWGERFEAAAVRMPAPDSRRRPRAPIDPSDVGDERNYTMAPVTGWPVGEEDPS